MSRKLRENSSKISMETRTMNRVSTAPRKNLLKWELLSTPINSLHQHPNSQILINSDPSKFKMETKKTTSPLLNNKTNCSPELKSTKSPMLITIRTLLQAMLVVHNSAKYMSGVVAKMVGVVMARKTMKKCRIQFRLNTNFLSYLVGITTQLQWVWMVWCWHGEEEYLAS